MDIYQLNNGEVSLQGSVEDMQVVLAVLQYVKGFDLDYVVDKLGGWPKAHPLHPYNWGGVVRQTVEEITVTDTGSLGVFSTFEVDNDT